MGDGSWRSEIFLVVGGVNVDRGVESELFNMYVGNNDGQMVQIN